MKQKIKQFYFLMSAPAKRDLPKMIGFFLLSSFMDVLGLGLVAGFLVMALNPSMIIQHFPASLRTYIDGISPLHLIEFVGITLIFAFIVKAVLGLYIQKRIAGFTANMNYYLKKRLISKMQTVECSYILKQNTGYLINKLNQVDSSTTLFMTGILNFMTNFMVMTGALIFLLYMHFLVTTCLAVGLFFIMYSQDFIFKKKMFLLG